MVKKIHILTIFKTIKSKFVRFLVNMLIVLLSIALISALGFLPYGFKKSYLKNYEGVKMPDVTIKLKDSNQTTGIPNDVITKIEGLDNVGEVTSFIAMDINEKSESEIKTIDRVYFTDFETENILKPTLVEGRLPENYDEILIQRSVFGKNNYEIGDEITFEKLLVTNSKKFTVVGIVNSPLYVSSRPDVAWNDKADTDNPDYIESIFFIDIKTCPLGNFLPKTDIFIELSEKPGYMTKEYDDLVNEFIDNLKLETNNEYTYLSLNENTSYKMFYEFNNTMVTISVIFPILFVLVCALVTYLIIEKLITEERSMIACEFSLGVSKGRIASKYLVFSVISTLFGVIGGYFLGVYLLTQVFYEPYLTVFIMHGIPFDSISHIGLIMSGVLMFVSIFVTLLSVYLSLKETPASLMLQKAPKPGKKVFIEKIGIIWNRLSFSFKSSVRNIFRNKKNLILTSLAVIGSTILILIGFGLNDSAIAMRTDATYKNVADTMGIVSFVIIIFGLAIGILVIYALASMNIDDRVREIAVLKVLGYYDYEGALYTSRELLLVTIFAALLGIPIGAGVIYVIFKAINFASITDVKWYSYVSTYGITVVASLLSCFLLFPKIKKIDFNISLKSVE